MSKLANTTMTFLRETYANMGDKDRFASLLTQIIETMPTFVRKELLDELFIGRANDIEKVTLALTFLPNIVIGGRARYDIIDILRTHCAASHDEAIALADGGIDSLEVKVSLNDFAEAEKRLRQYFDIEIRFQTDITADEDGFETRTMHLYSTRTVSDKQ